jgi:hypothetical protein
LSKVFVLDTNHKPLDPVHPGCARMLLNQGKASVFRRYPFTIILKFAVEAPEGEPLRVKIDPGSKTTGIAVVNDATGEVVFAANLEHRGGAIKYNRTMRGLPKEHWLDAANVGKSTPEQLESAGVIPLHIQACGHGRRQMCLMDRYGFPRTGPKGAKNIKGFQTGDIVCAKVTKGAKSGTHVGRVAVRATGSFNITTKQTTLQGISHRCCQMVHRSDGYSYGTLSLSTKEVIA